MIRTVILDDEKHCIESLRLDLTKYCPEVDIVAACTSSKEGLQAIKKHKPDLVFLDIEMPWMNGFELLDLLQPVDFDVIFVTAYDSYALKAFRVSAVDYLLKPISKDDLISAVQRVLKKVNESGTERIQALLDDYFTRQHQNRITIPEKDGYQFLDIPSILYAESDGNYSRIHIKDKPALFISMTLKDFEQKVAGNNFCRVHHSYLVNLDNVDKYVRSDGGYLVMKNGAIVPVSRAKKSELKAVIQV
jgi:two-component system LytT family response regulator